MMDASDNMTKLLIAATIYLVVAIMVATGLTLRGASIVADNEGAAAASFQQVGLAHDGTGVLRDEDAGRTQPKGGGQFEGIGAKMLITPAVQAIIASKRHIIF